MEKHLGKIEKIKIGMVGYQESQFGYGINFTFDGSMSIYDESGFKFQSKSKNASETNRFGQLELIFKDAKITDVSELEGIPVELTIDDQRLASWRILTEVI